MDIYIVTSRFKPKDWLIPISAEEVRESEALTGAGAAFSSYEKAVAYIEDQKNWEVNPEPMVFKHFDTDQEGVEMWLGEGKDIDGDPAYELITKYPLDAPFPFPSR